MHFVQNFPFFCILLTLMGAVVSSVLKGKHAQRVTLFLIGTSLTPATFKSCGLRPLVQGVALWFLIGGLALLAI